MLAFTLMDNRTSQAIDHERYPEASCIECGSKVGHYEELWTGNKDDELYSGWELLFCCHQCRDKDLPCETFRPIRLKPGTVV